MYLNHEFGGQSIGLECPFYLKFFIINWCFWAHHSTWPSHFTTASLLGKELTFFFIFLAIVSIVAVWSSQKLLSFEDIHVHRQQCILDTLRHDYCCPSFSNCIKAWIPEMCSTSCARCQLVCSWTKKLGRHLGGGWRLFSALANTFIFFSTLLMLLASIDGV